MLTFFATSKPNLLSQFILNTLTRSYCDISTPPGTQPRCLSIKNLNPHVRMMEYAVRGPLVIRAGEIQEELRKGVQKPFTEVIKANIGDCHAMGAKPITFIRQVLALITYPQLLDSKDFPEDVKKRARMLLDDCRGSSIGSYTDSPGLAVIRKHVAEYIEKRDGIPCDWNDIVLSSGASEGIKNVLKMMCCPGDDGKEAGVMIPIPQYPLYSATLTEYNLHHINYYLNEDNQWSLDISELQRALDEGKKHCCPRALVAINPGNPTGQVLSKENIAEVCKFAYDNKLFLLADEVYQDNIYKPTSRFHSFKKVLKGLGHPYDTMELASFMSCSKGYMGECGLRGGYVEVINLCSQVRNAYHKLLSVGLCSNVIGQAAIDCVVCPPQPGDPSYGLYMMEKKAALESLMKRAKLVEETFNTFQNFCCNPVQGAMYAFPRIELPPKAIEAAERRKLPPDAFYAFELLENTGICIVPGSGFGQKPGTYHFRTTILPQIEKLKNMLEKFNVFHVDFMKKYN